MTNGEKHIERLLSWYKEAVTEDGVCYLTADDKNTLAYAIKCCKHYEDIKKDIDTWMLRNEPSSLENPNCSEIPTGSTTKDYLGVDAISRQAINGYIDYILSHGMGKRKSFEFIKKFVANLPPVTPQEPKTGHWIENAPEYQNIDPPYICSECGNMHLRKTNYCDQCGAKMVELQESEDRE